MSKIIFWVVVAITCYRDGFTNASNNELSLFVGAGMLVAIAAHLIFEKEASMTSAASADPNETVGQSVPPAQDMNWVFFSVCSAHRQTNPQCRACHIGEWVDTKNPDYAADQRLFKDDPEAWIRKHNAFGPERAV